MSKDRWFAEYERMQSEFEDEHGRAPTDSEDMDIATRAQVRVTERMYEWADCERKRRREGGL